MRVGMGSYACAAVRAKMVSPQVHRGRQSTTNERGGVEARLVAGAPSHARAGAARRRRRCHLGASATTRRSMQVTRSMCAQLLNTHALRWRAPGEADMCMRAVVWPCGQPHGEVPRADAVRRLRTVRSSSSTATSPLCLGGWPPTSPGTARPFARSRSSRIFWARCLTCRSSPS